MSNETVYDRHGREFEDRVSRMKGLIASLVVGEDLSSRDEQIALACAMLDGATFIMSRLGQRDSWREFLREALEENINNEDARAATDALVRRVTKAAKH